MKTTDVPFLRQEPMAEKSTPSTSPSTAPKAAASSLAPAAESSDAAVHQLLAEREAARLNDDGDAVKDVDKRLADLGYMAG